LKECCLWMELKGSPPKLLNTTLDNNSLTFGQLLMRETLGRFTFIYFGFIIAALHPSGRGIHDFLSKTYVANENHRFSTQSFYFNKKQKERLISESRKICPYCIKEINLERLICPYCDEFLGPGFNTRRASLSTRFLAVLIDSFFVLLVPLTIIVFLAERPNPIIDEKWFVILSTICFVVFSVCSAVCISLWKNTPGKRLFNLKIYSLYSDRITLRQSILREVICKPVSIMTVFWALAGLAIPIISRRNQSIHDLWAGTYVSEIINWDKSVGLWSKIDTSSLKKAREYFYYGNTNSKVFHGPKCSHFNSNNTKTIFKTKEEAIAAGYRACGLCRP